MSGTFLGVAKVEEFRQLTVDRTDPLESVFDSLAGNYDEYMVVVRVGDRAFGGRFRELLIEQRGPRPPRNWPPNISVQVRFKKGGRTKVFMYVRSPAGKEVPTELWSVVGPDGHDECRLRKGTPDCSGASNP